MRMTAQMREDKYTVKFLLIYSAAATAVFFLIMMLYTGFRFSAPLDDAFIYLQYAKNMAKGHFFEYVAGEGYSSGATSFLYAFLLTPFAFFLKGGSMIIATYLTGGAGLFVSGYYLYKILKNMTEDRAVRFFGVLLYVTNGNILWGYFSGMEISVFAAAITASLYYTAYLPGTKRHALSLVLLSLVRPEGFILVIMLVFLKVVGRIFNKEEKVLVYILPLAAGASYFAVNYMFTGDFMPNTMRAKSDFSQYYYHAAEVLRHGLNKYTGFMMNIFNGGHEHYFLRYSFFIFLAGLMPGFIHEIRKRKPSLFVIGFFWFFAGVMSTVFSSFFTVHNYRYAMPFVILFVLFLSYGTGYLLEKAGFIPAKRRERIKFSVFSLFIVFNIFTIAANAVNFGRDARDIHSQSIQAGRWIKANLPEGSRVAINDVGAITYFSDAKVFDLVGLVTNKQARVFRNGIGAVYEELENIQPDYFMIHLGWFNFERFSFFGLSDRRIKDFHIKREPAYYVVGSPEVCVAPIPGYFGRGDSMKLGHSEGGRFAVADAVDVADMRSEEAHGYSIWPKRIPEVPGTLLAEHAYGEKPEVIIDAGRITGGGEEFAAKGLIPGKAVKIVRRSENPPGNKQDVFIDGKKAGEWDIERAEEFTEESFIIDGSFVKNNKPVFRFVEKSPNRYNSFYYWILQEE